MASLEGRVRVPLKLGQKSLEFGLQQVMLLIMHDNALQGYPTFARPPPDAPPPPPPPPSSYGGYGGPAPQQQRPGPPPPQSSGGSAAPTTRSVPLEKARVRTQPVPCPVAVAVFRDLGCKAQAECFIVGQEGER